MRGTPGSFAGDVLSRRHPALIEQVRAAHPYGPRQRRALDALLREVTEDVIGPLDPAAHDHARWARWGRGHIGQPWSRVPFLWAESYFYRRLLAAVEYFEPGTWQGVDPFAPAKRAELRGAEVAEELRALDALTGRPVEEQATALLHASLWGNRADLGFRATPGDGTEDGGTGDAAGSAPAGGGSAGGGSAGGGSAGELVADEAARWWSLLADAAPAAVALVADNTGRELIPDLVLVDHLLGQGLAATVTLYVKPAPYFVSDATTADVVDCLRRLVEAPGRAGATGVRLWAAMADGRLEVRTHPFFCAPLPYAELPADLRADLAAHAVTVLKGDLNYRRLVGDAHWPASTPFAAVTAYFPGPVVALRTLKSDVVVGLDAARLAGLAASGAGWRTGGSHALIQVRT